MLWVFFLTSIILCSVTQQTKKYSYSIICGWDNLNWTISLCHGSIIFKQISDGKKDKNHNRIGHICKLINFLFLLNKDVCGLFFFLSTVGCFYYTQCGLEISVVEVTTIYKTWMYTKYCIKWSMNPFYVRCSFCITHLSVHAIPKHSELILLIIKSETKYQ